MGWTTIRFPKTTVAISLGLLLLAAAAQARLVETGTMTDAEGSWDFILLNFNINSPPASDSVFGQGFNQITGVMTMAYSKTVDQFKKAADSGELVYLEIQVCHPGAECISIDMTDVAVTRVEIKNSESTNEPEAHVSFQVEGTIAYN